MKKNLFIIAFALIFADVGLAQSPVNLNKPATVAVNVVKHLEIKLVNEPNQFFTYNEFDPVYGIPSTSELANAEVTLETNVDWQFSVVTQNGATVLSNKTKPGYSIPANRFTYAASGNVTTGKTYQPLGPVCTIPIKGGKDTKTFKLYWKVNPKFTENYYAGDYKVDVSYVVSDQF